MAADSEVTKKFCAALLRETTPEFRLLAACCMWPAEAAEPTVRHLILSNSVNWERLLALGERHRVLGMLANALCSQDSIPAGIIQILKCRAEEVARGNMLQLALAAKVTQAMSQRGIRFVIMKGTPLAQALYGNIRVRHSKDIDLLINSDDLPSVQSVLVELEFHQSAGLSDHLSSRQTASWKKHRKHFDYKHQLTGVQLELHWRAFDNERLGSVRVENAEWVECSPGMRLPTLPREEMFALLCAHGAGHAWFRLKWLADVATMLAQSSTQEQEHLMEAAKERGLERPAEQAVLLCASLFQDSRIGVPQTSSAVGRWLARVARDALLQQIPEKSAQSEFAPRRLALSRLLLRPSWVYRWEEAKVYATSPADWKAVRLPDWLHFAYPVLRIPLWFWRRWSVGRRA